MPKPASAEGLASPTRRVVGLIRSSSPRTVSSVPPLAPGRAAVAVVVPGRCAVKTPSVETVPTRGLADSQRGSAPAGP
jgi:hypothetical protein